MQIGCISMPTAIGLLALSSCSHQGGAQTPSSRDLVTLLETSHDRDALQAAAVAMASSGNAQSVARLGDFFGRAEFLARLDDLSSPPGKTRRLQSVFATLAEHPSGATEFLCLELANSPAFLAVDERRLYLLPALAAVRPMSDKAVKVLRDANANGYYNLNVLLLVKNGSPNALSLFEEMIRDHQVAKDQRIDAVHASIIPSRTNPALLGSVERLLNSSLEPGVDIAVIESIFDDQIAKRFPPSAAPIPPPWETASKPALQKVMALSDQITSRTLPFDLSVAVKRTTERVQRLLAGAK